MSSFVKIGSSLVLSTTLALVGTGCAAPSEDEHATDETVAADKAADQSACDPAGSPDCLAYDLGGGLMGPSQGGLMGPSQGLLGPSQGILAPSAAILAPSAGRRPRPRRRASAPRRYGGAPVRRRGAGAAAARPVQGGDRGIGFGGGIGCGGGCGLGPRRLLRSRARRVPRLGRVLGRLGRRGRLGPLGRLLRRRLRRLQRLRRLLVTRHGRLIRAPDSHLAPSPGPLLPAGAARGGFPTPTRGNGPWGRSSWVSAPPGFLSSPRRARRRGRPPSTRHPSLCAGDHAAP